MYTWVRTVDIRDGKAPQAFEWSQRVISYSNDKFGLNGILQRNVTGSVNQLHFVVTYDSLADYEKVAAATLVDEGFQKLLAELAELNLFFAKTVVDNLYQTIP